MIPSVHFIISLIISFILYPYFGLSSLFVFIGGWLVDADHAFYYVCKFKDSNYKRMYHYFREKKFKKKVINIFHTIEFYILMFLLSFYNTYTLIISIGFFVHVITDLIYFLYIKKFSLRYWTLTGWIIDVIRK